MNVSINRPATVSDSEGAVITAAILQHVQSMRATESDGDKARADWANDPWQFVGRLEATGVRGRRVPQSAPADSWTAASRF